jgi:hypothetical protein
MNFPPYRRVDAPALADSAADSAGLISTPWAARSTVAVPLGFWCLPKKTPVEKIKRKKLAGDSLIGA